MLESLGHHVEEASPDLTELQDLFMPIIYVNTATTFKMLQIPSEMYEELTSNALQLAFKGFDVSGVEPGGESAGRPSNRWTNGIGGPPDFPLRSI